MKIYHLTAISEKGNNWAKFEVDQPIGPKEMRQFKNIDEAKGAPLIQQLFYLPFVKSVTLSEKTIVVERFDILEWEEVIEEVKEQLQTYLNEGGVVLEAQRNDKIPVSVYAESTPNPSVMKFVANKPLVPQSIEFKNIDDAKNSPLAQQLFHLHFVKEVFLDTNYVSITKYEVTEWDTVVMEVREFIRSFIEEGNIVLTESPTPLDIEKKERPEADLKPIEQQIVSILDEYIKPAVASDGGNIVFDSYNEAEKSVHVVLQGACSGCPSSTFTLKNGIENMLKEMMPGKIATVVAVNG
jgi:Fe-S cluster biogenesis protein NfuA|tara:strand:+ start:1626 stop:2516 length:891 start_codon:yes stop_codon:yes gene_type:complete